MKYEILRALHIMYTAATDITWITKYNQLTAMCSVMITNMAYEKKTGNSEFDAQM